MLNTNAHSECIKSKQQDNKQILKHSKKSMKHQNDCITTWPNLQQPPCTIKCSLYRPYKCIGLITDLLSLTYGLPACSIYGVLEVVIWISKLGLNYLILSAEAVLLQSRGSKVEEQYPLLVYRESWDFTNFQHQVAQKTQNSGTKNSKFKLM